jgi:hypothetical protein
MEIQADQHRRPAPEFVPGDEVLVQTSFFKLHGGIRPKLAPRYLGPFTVLKNIGPANAAYLLEFPQGMSRVYPIFPVSTLRPYRRGGNYQPPPDPVIINGEPEYQVDWIAATRVEEVSGSIKFTGWESRISPTGSPLAEPKTCPEKLEEFWNQRMSSSPETCSVGFGTNSHLIRG